MDRTSIPISSQDVRFTMCNKASDTVMMTIYRDTRNVLAILNKRVIEGQTPLWVLSNSEVVSDIL